MAERRVSRKLAAEARALRRRIDGRLAHLSVVDAEDESLPRIAERFRFYEDALDDQFRLFARQEPE